MTKPKAPKQRKRFEIVCINCHKVIHRWVEVSEYMAGIKTVIGIDPCKCLSKSAPQMKDALESVIRADTYIHERPDALAKARAALAAADGKE